MTAVITLRNVTKVYRDGSSSVRALDGVSLDVASGSLVVVEGPSGSGKSTLLGIIAGLCRVSSGTVTVDGKEISALSEDFVTLFRRERVGFVFQEFHLVRGFTVKENVELALMAARCPRGWRKEKIAGLLEWLDLGDLAGRDVSRLSGGERQRAAIARAVANDPSLLLADEPTSQVDAAAAAKVRGIFAELREGGTTVVVSSHDGRFAEGFSDAGRIVLAGGQICSREGGP